MRIWQHQSLRGVESSITIASRRDECSRAAKQDFKVLCAASR
jgi:hypothetical protein